MITLLLLISSKKYQNIIRCKFWSNCSLFLISTLNISYMLYLAMFFKKISMTMSQQPIWQIICNSSNKNNTHTHIGKLAYISRGKLLIGSLVRKVWESMQFVIYLHHQEFQKCNVAKNSISISHQNSIARTPFTHFISLRRWVFFFLCILN